LQITNAVYKTTQKCPSHTNSLVRTHRMIYDTKLATISLSVDTCLAYFPSAGNQQPYSAALSKYFT